MIRYRGRVRLTDALQVLQHAPDDAPPYDVLLACGFTPLHVRTFLAACLQRAMPGRCVSVHTGFYGDTAGTLEAAGASNVHAVTLALEWTDLDPRLGYRSGARWGSTALAGILTTAGAMADRLAAAAARIPTGIPVAVSLPTLPLPPLFHAAGWQSTEAELALQRQIAALASHLARRCSVVNPSRLAGIPPAGRFDLKSDLLAGLPYTVPHAAAVGEALALLLAPPAPKRGLITDLDDTLWHGLLGEVGPDGLSWDLGSHHQLHGLYQKLLSALADEGVLIGIASKNDPAAVRQALEREDLILRPRQVFPVEAHWDAKSGSVDRILRTWNIDAGSVVFVDDSPMELAEVAAAHPGIETVLFPKNDYAQAYAMLLRLRDLFGKPRLSEEDGIRLESIRQGAVFQSAAGNGNASEAFLQQAEAVVAFDFDGADPRALELVNKTNQFNLNGIRRTEAEWTSRLDRPDSFLAAVRYEDKFGPLGKIAVLEGRQDSGTLYIDTWVMSCRAFSRRIEHQCLKMLFDRYNAHEIAFAFSPTPKNGPLQDFFAAILGTRPSAPFRLAKAEFERACPPLYHRAIESHTSSNQWMKSQPA